MSKYSADIEIAVLGGQQLDRTIKTLNRLNTSINVVTRNAKLLEGRGFNVASIENYSRAVSKAERAVRKAAEGTDQERQAITALVSAMELENRARERKNTLIARQVANQRQVIATANAGVGIQGPALPSYMRTGPSSPVQGSRSLAGSPAALAAGTASKGDSRLGGALSGAVIGGSFPLLFGQTGGAAVGGAVGGLAGGLLGPGGSFAGSLLGTLLGEVASKGQQVKDLANDIGFTADQTARLQEAFALAGRDSDKFIDAVQNIRGLSLSLEDQADAVQLVSNLTETYGGKIDKVTNAFTGALESGKVTQATLNALTNQGIPIQETLAKKYDVSRDKLLQMVKDGQIPVQDLIDTLVNLGNTADTAATKTTSGWDKAWQNFTRAGSLALQAAVAVFNGITNSGVQSSGNIAANFSSLYVDLVEGAINMGVQITSVFANLARGAANVAATFKLGGLNIVAAANVAAFKNTENTLRAINTYLQQISVNAPKLGKVGAIKAPGQLPTSGSKSAANKAADEAKRLAEQTAQQLKSAQDLAFEQTNRLTGLRAENDYAKAFTDFSIQRLEIERRYNELLGQSKSEAETEALLQARGAEYKQSSLTLQQQINELLQAAQAPLDQSLETLKNQAAYEREYGELIKNGTNPELAKQLIEIRKAYNESVKLLDPALAAAQAAVTKAEAEGASATEIQKYREELEKIEAIRKGLEGKKTEGETIATALSKPKTEGQKIESQINTLKTDLEELTSISNQVIQAANAIGTAFQQAFMGLVSGAMTGEEALAAFFQGVGDHFMNMASEMIAKLLEIYILESVLGFIGGSLGGTGLSSTFSAGTASAVATDASGWATSFATAIPGFAEGGFVTSPTPAVVGEGGEPEYIIPASKMAAAMQRYGGGTRGSAVIPTSGDTSEAGGNAPPVNGAIDVRYTVERINSVDYVTADQFQQGMQQATMQGAQRGEQQALRRLQNSASTRRRLGI